MENIKICVGMTEIEIRDKVIFSDKEKEDIERIARKGERGDPGPCSLMEFDLKDNEWSKEYSDLQGMCLQIIAFLRKHEDLASTVIINKNVMKSMLN